jgi:organic hydroperoxide reductase OsmC/OhrA
VKQHTYAIRMTWTGNDGAGTEHYKSYRRDHVYTAPGKPELPGSSDPHFRGDASRYNPEELLVAALSSCHMLWYLHLCAINDVNVVEYEDDASGVMQENADGSGQFVSVTLKPRVKITSASDPQKAHSLHGDVHHLCYIARSVNFPVHAEASIEVAEAITK